MEATPELVATVLASGHPNKLQGCFESTTVDFKAEPYLTDTQRQKQELAKDVASFANANGGAIVLGFKTTKSGVVAADIVSEPRPFSRELFKSETWTKLLNDWIYPVPEGVTCQWFETPADPAKGFGVIAIPTQSASRRPFLVTRTAFEESKVEGAIFGLFERRRADSEPVSVYEVHARMRDGDLLRTAMEMRDSDDQSAPLGRVTPATRAATGRQLALPSIAERIDDLLRAADLADAPAYVLSAVPLVTLSSTELFGANASNVIELLRRPPEIRKMGFDLKTGAFPEIVEGRSRRAVTRNYKALELWRDGALVFVATGAADYLSWGSREEGTPLRVNPLVLAESTVLFCNLTRSVLDLLTAVPTAVDFALSLRGMCVNDEPPILSAGKLGAHVHPWSVRKAARCDLTVHLSARTGFDPVVTAYALRAEVYHWFGFEAEDIPYVSKALSEPSTNISEIRAP